MKIDIHPVGSQYKKCLVLVGGSGDTSKGFIPLIELLLSKLPNTSICTFSFTTRCTTESILDLQSRELEDVFQQLISDYQYNEINIFTTSMGAYPTIKLLASIRYSNIIKRVIFYDPADYYLSAKFGDSSDVTWSGSQSYTPTKEVVSDKLRDITGITQISVVHLTLKNYGTTGYIKDDFVERALDEPNGYPRISSQMVKSIYDKIPLKNKADYIEEPLVPHAFLRDGNVADNIAKVTSSIIKLL